MTTRKPRLTLKENRIPIGKKKEEMEKIKELKNNDVLELVGKHQGPLKKKFKTVKTHKEPKPLVTIDVNVALTNTSLTKPIEKPRTKLSTIKEIKDLEENVIKTIVKTKSNSIKTLKNNPPTLTESTDNFENESTKLVRNIQNMEYDFNNTVDEMKSKPPGPELVLSPYVCTTRGQKWKPSPRKPPKLSELLNKYEDDNIADTYRKKLDRKTIELQSKVEYWTELSSGNECNIPQSVIDEIDVVCGQTKLLTTDKFMQMRSLIEEFDNKSGNMPITTTDLDGFWDMLLLQVEKLEGQYSQLTILKENNWIPIQPIAKKVINKISKVNKHPDVKSKFADFIKNKKKETKVTTKSDNSDGKDESIKFHEMKSSNNNCIISSTPTSNKKNNVSYTPMLLKTMELSYVARRSGMTPIILGKPHVSPLKPAWQKTEQEKCTKRKNIHFETTSIELLKPENSYNDAYHKSNIQNRVATPHVIKTSKVNENKVVESQNHITYSNSTNAKQANNKTTLKSTVKSKSKIPVLEKLVVTSNKNDCTIRRSSRLANKPSKNYKC